MATYKEPIQQLYNRLQQLLKQHQLLLKENQQLKESLAATREEKQVANDQLDRLSLQLALLKSVTGQLGEEDKKEFSKKLGRFIKDIDQCITLLSE